MIRQAFLVLTSALASVACATVARVTLEDRFQAIGIPKDTALCMVDDLDQRLSDDDLEYLARYTVNVARARSRVTITGICSCECSPRSCSRQQ